MLTDKALEELRQERHDDYVAEAYSEQFLGKHIFLICFLEAHRDADILKEEALKRVPSFNAKDKNKSLRDALWNGYHQLICEASRCAIDLAARGHLLYAHSNTTKLVYRPALPRAEVAS